MKKSFYPLVVLIWMILGVFEAQAQGTDPYDICALNIGKEVPEVSVKDLKGEELFLPEICAKPTVLVFYRGGWCPYCNKQLSALQEARETIRELGFELVALSADKFDRMEKSIDKNELDYRLYSDNTMEASKAFGIAFRMTDQQRNSLAKKVLSFDKWAGEEQKYLPVPSVFIIQEGKIAFRYVNPDYKTRLTNEMLVAALKSLI